MVQLLRRHRQEDLRGDLGGFLFKTRNRLFIVLYAALFLPSPRLFDEAVFGAWLPALPQVAGFAISLVGQAVRCATIGLAYIVRGGREGRVYADALVTDGIFRHCRNPLYIGNILMLLGLGLMADSLIYIAVVMPVFLAIYHAIVATEERFLRAKFGAAYEAYCDRVNRWWPDFSGLGATFAGMRFNWERWLVKEYNTLYMWLSASLLVVLVRYPGLADSTAAGTPLSTLLVGLLIALLLAYLAVRHLKKSGRLRDRAA